MNALMLSAVYALGAALVSFIWQGALLGLAVAATLVLLRNARPQTRYAVACTGLALCVALPLLTFVAYFGRSNDDTVANLALDAVDDGALPAAGLAMVSAWVQAHMAAIVAGWALCVALLGLRMAYGLAWVARMCSAQRSSGDRHWQTRLDALARRIGIERNVALRVVQGIDTPASAGWWRPVVLVPAALICGMPPDLLEALLAHEIAHIRRFDYLVNLVQSMIETVLFYHPAVWWISGRIRIEREHIADDLAAGILGEPRRLALALQELEKIQFSTTHLAQAAHGGNLMVRIKRLIRPETHALDWKVLIPTIGLAVAGVAFCANATLAEPTSSAAPAAQNTSPGIADLNACKPMYPRQSLDRKEEGTVRVSFRIDSTGHLVRSRVVKSSGHPMLDQAVVSGLSACAFKPGMKSGKPIGGTFTTDYVWKLEE